MPHWHADRKKPTPLEEHQIASARFHPSQQEWCLYTQKSPDRRREAIVQPQEIAQPRFDTVAQSFLNELFVTSIGLRRRFRNAPHNISKSVVNRLRRR